KNTRPRIADLVMSLPQDELTACTVTCSRNRDCSAFFTLVCSGADSSPALTRIDRLPPAPTICGVFCTSAPACSATDCTSAGCAVVALNWNWVPPSNSMPKLNPRTMKLVIDSSSSTADTQYQRLRLPMKSKTASPAS